MSKKYRIKNKFRFITSLTILMLLLAFTSSALFGFGVVSGKNVRQYLSVQVQPGDTLWNLALAFGPKNVDPRKVVYEIEKYNNVSPETLFVGDYISIPQSL